MKKIYYRKTKYDAPLYNGVLDYAKDKKITRFHMPSHKGKSFSPLYNGSSFDITELDFSDNLLKSEGIIKQAEDLLATQYQVDNAFMFTAGSTCAIFASIYVAKQIGGKILLSKNSHKSVYNAISVLGIEPVFCDVEYDEDGFPLPISAKIISNSIKKYPDIKSVFITSPDYFGRVCDLDKIRTVCKDLLLIADSAHGAHFAFTQDLTERAEKVADICALSMHKTLPCFTGSSIATCKSKWASLLKKGREIFHTTSPYYPSMISMDYARAMLRKKGVNLFEKLKKEIVTFDRVQTYDYTKLLLRGGEHLSDYLKQNKIYPECVFGNFVLCIVLPWDIAKLKKLKKVLSKYKAVETKTSPLPSFDNQKLVVPFNEVIFSDFEWINLEDAEKRISASEVGLYPPGTPIVIRGEIFDKNKINFLLKNKNTLFGVDSGRVCVLK